LEENKMAETVKKGDKVKVEYTGKLADGTVFDTSKDRSPLSFEVGAGQVIPGFDKALDGMELNQEKTVTIPVEEAYGPVRAELVQEIPRDKLPENPEPQVGMALVMQSPDGRKIPARITKVQDGNVTIDINHPLAGKELTFELKVVGINEPEEEKKEEDEGSGKKEDNSEGKEENPEENTEEGKEEENKEETKEEGSSEDNPESSCGSECSSCAGCK